MKIPKISVTTLLGWLRFAICTILVGHVIFTAAVHGIYFIDGRYSVAMLSIFALVDKFLGGLQGQYTADAKTDPSDSANPNSGE